MKKLILFSTVLLLATLLLALAMPASATPPENVSGKYWLTEPYANMTLRQAGQNCFIEVDATYPFTGDLVGTATAHFRALSHGPCETAYPFANPENLYAQGTFTGLVAGKSGTFDFVYEGRAWPAEPGETALDVRIVILSGTEELAGLHGMLGVSYVMGDPFDSYSGQIHFDP